MKKIFYHLLATIQFKIDDFLTDKGYYDDIITDLDSDFWGDYE